MDLHYENGNLLDAPMDYICQQVNCQGRMNSGIAKQIIQRWPIVYDRYIKHYSECENLVLNLYDDTEDQVDVSEVLLGQLQKIKVNNTLTVVNMFAQQYYGYDGEKYTSYDAFWNCLKLIKKQIPKGSKIGFPWHIGCGLGGADWEVIQTMIKNILAEDYEVYIYKLEGDIK